MSRISKLALLSTVILLAVIYIWMTNPLLALILGSISLVPFMKNIFEIKKYHNRNLYLLLSSIVLFLGSVSTGVWILDQNEILNRAFIAVAAGLLILSTLQTAFSSTRKWDKIKIN